MPWDGNEGKRMAGVTHSEKSEGFHSSGLPIKNNSPHSENSLLKIISQMNPLNLLNHREAVCLYINKFLRNDWADGADVNGDIFNHRFIGWNGFFLTTNRTNETNLFWLRITQMRILAFLTKAPSGWFPKSRQGSPNSSNSCNSLLKKVEFIICMEQLLC